jgi:hypothetical protein
MPPGPTGKRRRVLRRRSSFLQEERTAGRHHDDSPPNRRFQPVLDAASKYKAIPQPLAARDLLVATKP